jgi:hypothetical protein
MSPSRTIFHHNKVPIQEENRWAKEWISVQRFKYELDLYFDKELMTFVFQSLQADQFKVSKKPKHHKEPLWVSFPTPDEAISPKQCLADVIALVQLYREDIIDVRLVIDRSYLSGKI